MSEQRADPMLSGPHTAYKRDRGQTPCSPGHTQPMTQELEASLLNASVAHAEPPHCRNQRSLSFSAPVQLRDQDVTDKPKDSRDAVR